MLQNGEQVTEALLDWNGTGYGTSAVVPVKDGYEYCFVLRDSATSQQVQILEAFELADLATNSTLTSGSDLAGLEYDPDAWKLEIHMLYYWAAKPVFGGDADQTWTEFALELYRNDELLEHRSFIEDNNENSRGEPTISIDIGSILFRDVKLEEGDTLELRFRAALSNGAETESTVGIWQYSDGKLAELSK